jgi:hypothetical protein
MKPTQVAFVIGGDASVLMQELTGKTTFIRIQNYEMLMNVVLSTDTKSPQTIVWENADESYFQNPSRYVIRLFAWGRFYNTGCIFTFKSRISIHPVALTGIDYFVVFRSDSTYETLTEYPPETQTITTDA